MQKGKTPNLQIKEGNINGKQKSKIFNTKSSI